MNKTGFYAVCAVLFFVLDVTVAFFLRVAVWSFFVAGLFFTVLWVANEVRSGQPKVT